MEGTGGEQRANDGNGDGDEWGELEIEVTDLRTGASVERPLLRRPAERPPRTTTTYALDSDDVRAGDSTGGDAREISDLPLNGPAARVRPPHVVRGALVAGVVVLVLVGLLASNPGVSGALQTRLFPPTPTLVPGSNTIWVHHTVPWGTLTIDGRAMARPDANTPFLLGRGQHILLYDAPPFHAVRCTVSVPKSRSDTCPLDTAPSNQLNAPPPGERAGERALDLGATPQKLPAASYKALTEAIQAQLDTFATTTELAPADHYGTPAGKVQVAQVPMSVTLAFVVAPANPSGAAVSYDGEDCNPLCTISNGPGDWVTEWPISAVVNPQWRYTDDDGAPQVVMGLAPMAVQTWGGFAGNLLTFSVRWTGLGWQAQLPQINTFSTNQAESIQCQAAMQALPPMDSSSGVNGFSIQPGTNTITLASLAEGCAIGITPQNSNGTPSGQAALLLVRCGALIAANDAAHTMFRTLPVANAREAALAQQLGATLHS